MQSFFINVRYSMNVKHIDIDKFDVNNECIYAPLLFGNKNIFYNT